jgi:hypothetical protein
VYPEKVRSALNRATRKAGSNVATASDADFLYVWIEKPVALGRFEQRPKGFTVIFESRRTRLPLSKKIV